MSDTGFFTCKRMCWIVGGLIGFALFLMISGIIGFIIGVIAAVALAVLLRKMFCTEIEAAAAQTSSVVAAGTEPDADVTAIPAAALDGSIVTTTSAPAKAAEVSQPEEVAATATEESKPADATAAKPVAKKTAAKKAPAKKAATKKPAAKAAAAEPTGKPKKPRTMKAPRKSGADDLKQLKGVGPKLEQTLNGLGFWHFDQIAKWGPDEISWVDDNLSFKGRIERDGWVDQAKVLAEGGETAFSSKVKKGKVY